VASSARSPYSGGSRGWAASSCAHSTTGRPSGARLVRGILHAGSGSAGRFWDARLAATVRAATSEAPVDVLQVEYSTLGPYLRGTSARLRVLDLHNIESSLAASYARSVGPVRAIPVWAETLALRRLERAALRLVDVATVVSQRDRERLPHLPAEVLTCPNGWESGPMLPAATEPVVIFVALLSWRPNADAAIWLAERVWPLVRRHRPDARLLLVGRAPTPEVRRLAGPDITVTGTVPDVRPFLTQARVAVAPLRSGGGARLKVLEALDAGRPVVATRIGAEGLDDLVGRGVIVTDAAETMAEVVLELLADDARVLELGAAGHQAVMDRYDWDVTLRPLIERIRC
jgi:glycosyltransferase involved in cell wall biosynthesis